MYGRINASLIASQREHRSESKRLAGVMRLHKKNPDDFLNLLQESAFQGSQKIGIACFSLNWQAAPMWAHYSSDHFGYCLGLDLNHDFFRTSLENILLRITYLSERPILDLSCFMKNGLIESLLGFKDEKWKYEEEIRLVRYFDQLTNSGKTDRRNLPVYGSRIPDDLIKEVVIGYRCEPALEHDLVMWASQLPKAKIYKISIPPVGFNLSRVPIDLSSFRP